MNLLFVCLGNICRSPAAEGVMRRQLEAAGLHERVTVDSAGIIDDHRGNPPDARMRQAASRRGLDLRHRARQVRREDLREFDLILAMDSSNLADLAALDPGRTHAGKIRLFCEFCTRHDRTDVPDPYYGGEAGFELVLDLLEDGCESLLRGIQAGSLSPP